MIDSEMILALVLERRFGQPWLQRWQQLADPEVCWLAIFLADEADHGRELRHGDQLDLLIEHGRRWLPAELRTIRPVLDLATVLRQAQLWPQHSLAVAHA